MALARRSRVATPTSGGRAGLAEQMGRNVLREGTMSQSFRVELELEADGRWIAEIPELPGVMVYGSTRDDALAKVEALALRVIAEQLEHGERPSAPLDLSFAAA